MIEFSPNCRVWWPALKCEGSIITIESNRAKVLLDNGDMQTVALSAGVLERDRFKDGEQIEQGDGRTGIISGPGPSTRIPDYEVLWADGGTSVEMEASLRRREVRDPIDRVRAGVLSSARDFNLRSAAADMWPRNQSEELVSLAHARVDLQPHQVSVAHRVMSKFPHRFLLCDEVGLGKTIEAAMILNTALNIDVLTNDTDPDTPTEELSVQVVSQPAHGRAVVESDRTITYTPNLNSNSRDSFEYRVSDGSLSDTGFVYITEVAPVNDRPVFPTATVEFQVSQDSEPGDLVGYPLTAVDVEQDTLTYSLDGADAVKFEIDSDSGQITTTGFFDQAQQETHVFKVIARERDNPSQEAEADVTVTVVEGVVAAVSRPEQRTGEPSGGAPGGLGGFGGFAGGGGGFGAPAAILPSEEDFDYNVTRDLETLDRENRNPTGLWSDGAVIWVLNNADAGADSVFAYDLDTKERRPGLEFPLDNRNRFSHGIWSDGATVWVADSGQDRLFAYDLETGERIEARELELGEDNRDPRGIWSDGEVIYVLDSVRDRLFVYALESGELLASYPLDALNQNPRGVWSDGVTIWISDDGANRVLAYRLEDGSLVRIEAEEFDFRVLSKAGNGEARGIWSDGDVLWVADEEDAKVLSYNLPDAAQARLASLSLSGVEFEFSSNRLSYSVEFSSGQRSTTVRATPAQPLAVVSISPPDGDAERDGHQVDLDANERITVTVTSADGSRERTYEISIEPPSCFEEALTEPLSEVGYTGGTVTELAVCARQLGATAIYHLDQGVWSALLLDPGLPDFLSQPFRNRFRDGVPAAERLIVKRDAADSN